MRGKLIFRELESCSLEAVVKWLAAASSRLAFLTTPLFRLAVTLGIFEARSFLLSTSLVDASIKRFIQSSGVIGVNMVDDWLQNLIQTFL